MATTRMQDRANTAFKKKEERAREGARAMDEYNADSVSEMKKRDRRKALRLANEAEDAAHLAANPPAPKKPRKAKAKAKKKKAE